MTPIKGSENRSFRENSALRPVAPLATVPSGATGNPALSIGFYLMLGYVFLSFSRILDVSVPGLRIPLVLYVSMLLATLLSGLLFAFLKTSIGRWLFVFALWVVVTTPFSTWPGGSASYVVDTFRSFILVVIIIGLTTDIPRVFKLLRMIAYAILMGALLGFVYGQMSYGRLILTQGTYGDPNQYAMMLLFGLPFWLWISRTLPLPGKMASYLCMAPIFVAFLRTGSRGAGVGFVAFCGIIFWRAPLLRKAFLCLGLFVLIAGSLAVLPEYLKQRYLTVFRADTTQITDEREREMLEGADIHSSQARLTLLLDSIVMTAEHPLFGVGAGQFAYQDWLRRKEGGQPGVFNVTHNTYTQISSELGVPGLIIFLGLLISCFRALRSVSRLRSSSDYSPPPQVIDAANYIFLALAVLSVCGFFLALAFGPLFYVIAAVITVFHRSVQSALPGWRVARVAAGSSIIQKPSAWPSPALATAILGRRVSYRK